MVEKVREWGEVCINKATGDTLSWLVAKADGWHPYCDLAKYNRTADQSARYIADFRFEEPAGGFESLMEKHRISIYWGSEGWVAYGPAINGICLPLVQAETRTLAGLRALVFAKLATTPGGNVQVPKELIR